MIEVTGPKIKINPNPNLKTEPNPQPNPKVTIMYAVQNDTEIKFDIVLYITYFPRDSGEFIRAL